MSDNPYGLLALLNQGDAVIKGVAVTLLLMSIVSWYVIVTRAWRAMRLRRSARVATGFGMLTVSPKVWRCWIGSGRTIPFTTWRLKARRRWIITLCNTKHLHGERG